MYGIIHNSATCCASHEGTIPSLLVVVALGALCFAFVGLDVAELWRIGRWRALIRATVLLPVLFVASFVAMWNDDGAMLERIVTGKRA